VGTSLTLGQAFIMEQVEPATSLVATISVPKGFKGQITKLLVTLASTLPVTGPSDAVLAAIDNVDADGDGEGNVDQILNSSRDLVLGVENVGVTGDYHVVAALYMEGGGQFQPVPGIDYQASSQRMTLGPGKVEVALELELITPTSAAGDRATDNKSGGEVRRLRPFTWPKHRGARPQSRPAFHPIARQVSRMSNSDIVLPSCRRHRMFL
jgi:hypothetical protein